MFGEQSYSRGKFLVNSKETVVLCRWESEKKLSFIKRVDKGQISPKRRANAPNVSSPNLPSPCLKWLDFEEILLYVVQAFFSSEVTAD